MKIQIIYLNMYVYMRGVLEKAKFYIFYVKGKGVQQNCLLYKNLLLVLTHNLNEQKNDFKVYCHLL